MPSYLTRLVVLGFVSLLAIAATAGAVVVRSGGLQVTVLSQIIPYKLPREKPAPIAVFVAGHLAAVGGGTPPQLQRMTVEVNRHGLLQWRYLPVCHPRQIQPATTERALDICGQALIGSGQFWAHIILPGQSPYLTKGRLLIFNGRQHGRPVLLAQIFTSHPFNSAFLINFAIRHIDRGPYGTELSASFPQALGDWGYLDRIKLTLKRKYRARGRLLSYFNSSCPAPPGARVTAFPLARASFYLADDRKITATVDKSCGVL